MAPADELTLSVTGPFEPHAPNDDSNLVLRAARLLQEHVGGRTGAAIALEKNLPAGAGFGGGSSDAAATLLALNRLWHLRLNAQSLGSLAEKLGSDVPMCLEGRALRAQGRGERIETIAGGPPLPMVLVWPGRTLSTTSVFAALTQRDGAPLTHPPDVGTIEDLAAWLANCRNDLEDPAVRLAPEIGKALGLLQESEACLIARMSGSGSGCFAIYSTREEADRAAESVQNLRPGWWAVSCEAR